MRKQLSFMNEDGFMLPYVLFIVTIILVVLTTSIHMYKQDTIMTYHHTEQLKIESLIQMGLMSLKTDHLHENIDQDKATYSFPDGTVHLSFLPSTEDDMLLVQLTVYTKNGSSYQTEHVMTLSTHDKSMDSFQHFSEPPQ